MINFNKVYSRINNRYGHLTIVDFEGYLLLNEKWKLYLIAYQCRCDCGNTVVISYTNLKKGVDTSCGKEGCPFTPFWILDRLKRKGASQEALYAIYNMMIQRCYNPKAVNFKDYGGRGIHVCKRWEGPEGFWHFKEDMGERPEGYSLSRIDNDGHYSPENCEWASRKDQARNKRDTTWVTIGNTTKSLAFWIEILSLKNPLVRSRILQGWPIAHAMWFPPPGKGAKVGNTMRDIKRVTSLKF